MEWLASKNINMTIPVAEGQELAIDRGVGDIGDVTVIYDMYDAGDILATMPNGTDAKEYTFIQYMTTSAALAKAGDHLLDLSLSPGEFPDFPCGKVVPARSGIDILGIIGAPVSEFADPGNVTSQYLKLIKDREILFDEDRNGIPFFATEADAGVAAKYITDMSLIGDCVSVGADLSDPGYGLPLLFDPPLHFVSGEELLVYLNVGWVTPGTLAATDVRVAMIEHVKVE